MLAETVEKWFRDAERKGRRQGLEKGLRRGRAQLLLRLVERRFGEVAPERRARIEAADAEQLLRWGDRLLDAASLAEMLGD
jgi:hypothetical protein